jgi:hypothetical protein
MFENESGASAGALAPRAARLRAGAADPAGGADPASGSDPADTGGVDVVVAEAGAAGPPIALCAAAGVAAAGAFAASPVAGVD